MYGVNSIRITMVSVSYDFRSNTSVGMNKSKHSNLFMNNVEECKRNPFPDFGDL